MSNSSAVTDLTGGLEGRHRRGRDPTTPWRHRVNPVHSMTFRPMLTTPLRFSQSPLGLRHRLIALACTGLLAPISVACGSGGASTELSSPAIIEMSSAFPEAAEAPVQPREEP